MYIDRANFVVYCEFLRKRTKSINLLKKRQDIIFTKILVIFFLTIAPTNQLKYNLYYLSQGSQDPTHIRHQVYLLEIKNKNNIII